MDWAENSISVLISNIPFVFYPTMWLLYLRGKVTTFCMMTINLNVKRMDELPKILKRMVDTRYSPKNTAIQ